MVSVKIQSEIILYQTLIIVTLRRNKFSIQFPKRLGSLSKIRFHFEWQQKTHVFKTNER